MDYGILSIIPAVLAIVLAMITESVLLFHWLSPFRRIYHHLRLEPDRGLPGNDPHAHFSQLYLSRLICRLCL